MKRTDSAKQQLGRRLVQWGGARAPTREAGFRGSLEGSCGDGRTEVEGTTEVGFETMETSHSL